MFGCGLNSLFDHTCSAIFFPSVLLVSMKYWCETSFHPYNKSFKWWVWHSFLLVTAVVRDVQLIRCKGFVRTTSLILVVFEIRAPLCFFIFLLGCDCEALTHIYRFVKMHLRTCIVRVYNFIKKTSIIIPAAQWFADWMPFMIILTCLVLFICSIKPFLDCNRQHCTLAHGRSTLHVASPFKTGILQSAARHHLAAAEAKAVEKYGKYGSDKWRHRRLRIGNWPFQAVVMTRTKSDNNEPDAITSCTTLLEFDRSEGCTCCRPHSVARLFQP